MNEQRQHPRYAIELDAEARFGETTVVGRTHDVSRGGFCLHLPQPLPVGAEGEVKLALVFSENQFSEQLSLPATIVWCTRMQSVYQVGIKFGALSPEGRNYLSLFIQFLEGGEGDEDEDEEEDSP